MTKKIKVEVEWKLLQRIAEYYQFPSAVFLGSNDMFKHQPKTRNKALNKVIIVAKGGKQMVELVPVQRGQRRKFGSAKGKIKIAPDFDAPLADFNAYMA